MKLLIVDDNKKLAESMRKGFEQLGCQSEVVYDGARAEERIFENHYDCVLLDLNLPEKDGLEILEFLRKAKIDTPVVIISATDKVETKAKGLNLGADDYLVKPFQLVELHARILAVVRRYQGRCQPKIQIGILEIDCGSRMVKIKEQPILISSREFDILEYIAKHHPAFVTTEEIEDYIYGDRLDYQSSVLRVHIAKLRKKLNEASDVEILKNMRSRGYYICEITEKR